MGDQNFELEIEESQSKIPIEWFHDLPSIMPNAASKLELRGKHFRIDIAARYYQQNANVTSEWRAEELVSAVIKNSEGFQFGRISVTLVDISPTAPRSPFDVTKTASLTSENLAPGVYSVTFNVQWAAWAFGNALVAGGGGGQLLVDSGTAWGETFAPSQENMSGKAERSFLITIEA